MRTSPCSARRAQKYEHAGAPPVDEPRALQITAGRFIGRVSSVRSPKPCRAMSKTYIVELEHVLLDLRMSKTYALSDLAEALRFNPSYVRMVIRKFDRSFKEGDSISEELAKQVAQTDRKSTRLNSSHVRISYAVFCL